MNLFNIVIRLLAEKTADRVSNEVKNSLTPIAPYLRRITSGIALIIVSALLWFVGFFFLLVSFFFYISAMNDYSIPALWTGLIGWFISNYSFDFRTKIGS